MMASQLICIDTEPSGEDCSAMVHGKTVTAQTPVSRSELYRGLYSRVGRQLGVDPSYVSRVAHGKRHSPKIERKLKAEIARIEKLRPK